MNNETTTPVKRQLLSSQDVQEEFGIPRVTLEVWRCRRKGPPFVRIGTAIRYDRTALEAWLTANTVTPAA